MTDLVLKYKFGRKSKIRDTSDFVLFRHSNACFYDRNFIIKIKTNLRNENPRLAVIVSKRVGNAVMRNKIKRLFREIFRLHQHKLPTTNDYLIIAKKGICCAYHKLENRFLTLLNLS